MKRIVGGKCVLLPSNDARVGKPRDRELLDFAIACLADCDQTAGIRITTGQDLGHGLMSDGRTQSLDYLNEGFPGSVVANMFSFQPAQLLDIAKPEAREAPKVSFG